TLPSGWTRTTPTKPLAFGSKPSSADCPRTAAAPPASSTATENRKSAALLRICFKVLVFIFSLSLFWPPGLLVVRRHFWPFTAVLRKIWPGVTQKVWIFPDTTDQRTLRIGEWSPRRPSLPLSAASRNASRAAQSSNIEIGSRQAAAN